MRCPNCDTKIKDTSACPQCGTKVADIKNASYLEAKKVLKSGNLLQREKIFYSKIKPQEISYKKMLLLSIVLGLFGAHDFYVGKFYRAIVKVVCVVIAQIITALVYYEIAPMLMNLAGFFMAYPFLAWIYDAVRVIFKRYPYPYIIVK